MGFRNRSREVQADSLNLLANALKFSDGDVHVVVQCSSISGEPKSVDVVDQGIGIAPNQLESIFEAFQQADNSTSRQFGGTGLGLTISWSLARVLGFNIEVSSELGVGSTFRVVLGSSSTADQAPTRLLA
ncbi:MAG: ATP-binding protein [Gemmatimonadota bacterium]|nr:ATP-binding protein [Gemmatimonadota bacterium]